jgi:hypothetical protein
MAQINSTREKLRYIGMVKQRYPQLFKAAVARMGGSRGLSGLGVTSAEMMAAQDAFAEPGTASSSWLTTATNTLLDTIKQLAPAYVGVQQAKTCLQINADRARQNLAPIDCASGGMAPQVAVGISPDVKLILWGALGIGAVWLLMKKR